VQVTVPFPNIAWCGKHSKTAVSLYRELFPAVGLYILSVANLGIGGGEQLMARKRKNYHFYENR
jgi:hypothetical protein